MTEYQAAQEQVATAYDRNYKAANYFRYRPWMYRPYVKALATRAGLRAGATVLDVGCGQGFFTSLFGDLGFQATGIDLSTAGIAAAMGTYRGPRFFVGDALNLPFREQFDCVFTRSCSLYNTREFGLDDSVTQRLLEYVKPGGVFIFDYYTRLRKSGEGWIYHQREDVRKHFSRFAPTQTYFSLRLDAMLFGAGALTRGWSDVAAMAGGLGGELVAIVRKN